MEKARKEASSLYPEAAVYRILPSKGPKSPIKVEVRPNKGSYAVQHAMWLDPADGDLLKKRDHSEKNMGERLVDANYDIHTGAILGLPGKILAFIASLLVASLPVTGFLIWWWKRPS